KRERVAVVKGGYLRPRHSAKTQKISADIAQTRADLRKEPQDGNQIVFETRGWIGCWPEEPPVQSQAKTERPRDRDKEQEGASESAEHQMARARDQPGGDNCKSAPGHRKASGFVYYQRALAIGRRYVVSEVVSGMQSVLLRNCPTEKF